MTGGHGDLSPGTVVLKADIWPQGPQKSQRDMLVSSSCLAFSSSWKRHEWFLLQVCMLFVLYQTLMAGLAREPMAAAAVPLPIPQQLHGVSMPSSPPALFHRPCGCLHHEDTYIQ